LRVARCTAVSHAHQAIVSIHSLAVYGVRAHSSTVLMPVARGRTALHSAAGAMQPFTEQ
jgi:hypothetical protein